MPTVGEPAPDTVLEAGLARLAAAQVCAEVVMVLARAATVRGGRDLRAATRTAAAALERSLGPATPPVPGLDGTSGAAWALVEAARAVDDKALGWRALALAATVPTRCADPGLARGTAGVGLTQLRLWLAYRDPRSRTRLRECVDELVHAGTADPGAGAVLLVAGRVLGVRAALRAADATAAALHATAHASGAAPTTPAAAFLVRHHAATGSPRSLELAERAAMAAGSDADPRAGSGADPDAGHLLLDLASVLGGVDTGSAEHHRRRAGQLVARLRRRGDPRSLALRLRMRHGGPRPWTVEGSAVAGLATAC